MKAKFDSNYYPGPKTKKKISDLEPDTFIDEDIYFDGTDFFVTCPECEHEQADMGHHVSCEECGHAPMPTHEDLDWLEED